MEFVRCRVDHFALGNHSVNTCAPTTFAQTRCFSITMNQPIRIKTVQQLINAIQAVVLRITPAPQSVNPDQSVHHFNLTRSRIILTTTAEQIASTDTLYSQLAHHL